METTKYKLRLLNQRMSKIFISDPNDEVEPIEELLVFNSERPYYEQNKKKSIKKKK